MNPIQAQNFALAGSGVTSTATTVILRSFKYSDGSTNITMTDVGTIGYATFEPGTVREENCSFTGVTQNADGTATLTGVVRGLKFKPPYDQNTALRYAHSGSTVFVMSNSAPFYDSLKDYIDAGLNAGAANSSTTTKGIGRVSVAPVDPVTPIFVGDNDGRVPTQAENDAMAGGSGGFGTPSSTNKYVTEDYIGTLGTGDGSDGDVTISSPTTLARDMYYNNLTVTSTLTTGGFIIFVKGTLNGAGTIQAADGNAGTAGGAGGGVNGGTAGVGGAASTTGRFKTNVGGAGASGQGAGGGGGVGTAGGSGNLGTSGGAGGGGGNSGNNGNGFAGGAAGSVSLNTKIGITRFNTIYGLEIPLTGILAHYKPSSGGGGGGSAGSGGAGGGTAGSSGGSGGGGASGGLVYIVCGTWAGTFIIKTIGGAGGNGGASSGGYQSPGGPGGGGGGGGGCAVIVYATKTWAGSYNLVGGTGGTAGAAAGGNAGVNGTTGVTGTSYEIDLSNVI